jgi:hypothetical protein
MATYFPKQELLPQLRQMAKVSSSTRLPVKGKMACIATMRIRDLGLQTQGLETLTRYYGYGRRKLTIHASFFAVEITQHLTEIWST